MTSVISNISTLGSLLRAAILVAIFGSDACKGGKICPKMHLIAKLTNIPKHLLSADENNYGENYTWASKNAPPLLKKICHNCNHSFRIKNIKEGFLFRFNTYVQVCMQMRKLRFLRKIAKIVNCAKKKTNPQLGLAILAKIAIFAKIVKIFNDFCEKSQNTENLEKTSPPNALRFLRF